MSTLLLFLSFALQAAAVMQAATPIPSTHLQTRWAAEVTPGRVLPEYPRPQMARKQWTNLNGTWDYAITGVNDARPDRFTAHILVPFPIESQLSGAGVWVSPQQRLWYHRTFTTPASVDGQRLLLNFGAVDWEAEVIVDGHAVGQHRGGYDPFTFDIRRAPNEHCSVCISFSGRGHHTRSMGLAAAGSSAVSIWDTEVTGIWRKVWLETVPETYIASVRIDPDLESGTVKIAVSVTGPAASAPSRITVLDGTRVIARVNGHSASARIASPHRWSPSDPFLYGLRVQLDSGDQVESYFGMRSIAARADASGVRRLFLNGEPLFEFGLLDQGWWPDGLYTPRRPTRRSRPTSRRRRTSASTSSASTSKSSRTAGTIMPIGSA